ncbi:hypothetical protein HU200_040848 [Digitaria exilis]|uniref:Tyrosine-specific transport protein n=1 Tax=Digitaria exilis TaxID=1010633 RepID=A0A835BD31_9POAL|nr:hypothetical protein HU200_040848 [Digitaria exilis]
MLLSSRIRHHPHRLTPSSPPAISPSLNLRRLRPLRPPTLASANTPPPSTLQFSFPLPRRQWRGGTSGLVRDAVLELRPIEADGGSVNAAGEKKSFWGAVSLIIGTAVGPGMLGLPSATIRSGQAPSAAAILLSWAYVVSSIVLVAELSFSAMERDGVDEIVGDSVYDARRAILIGGAVPLAMVLSWNAVILGLASAGGNAGIGDPIKLLLSVNPAALPAVRGFAFAALATSLIGYAVSFPKQLSDTVELIVQRFSPKHGSVQHSNSSSGYRRNWVVLTWTVLIVPIFIASFFSAAFSRALDFAGVYANCFLFGILPPVMAWIHRSQKRKSFDYAASSFRSPHSCEDILPGGNAALFILFSIAMVLAVWH